MIEKLPNGLLIQTNGFDVIDKLNEVIHVVNELQGQKEKQDWPRHGDEYWIINEEGGVFDYEYRDHDFNLMHKEFGNIFHTKEEAEAARDKVKELLLSLKKS